jgi:seryl-tRNA synthetase
LNIRAGHRESDEEKVSRYINGLRYEIQDEINMMTMRMVEDAYQVALKAEEKLAKNKANETEEKVQAEVEELSERSSRNPNLKLESITVIQKEEEVPEVDNMVEETLFLEEEEEAEEEK